MPTYLYHALDPQGRRCRDLLQADSERHARQLLRERGLFARRLELQGQDRQTNGGVRLSHAQLCELTRQLATLLGAAIPLAEALATLERQLDSATRRVLVAIGASVGEGHGLAESLRRHGAPFDTLYCAWIEAGERSGRLAQVLERLADYLEQVQRQRHKARTALIYPAVLMLVSVIVVVGLMTFVVPRLTEQFEHMNRSLPSVTQVLIGLSDVLVLAGPWLLGLLMLLAMSASLLLRRPQWRYRRDRLLLGLPRLGELLRVLESARLSRSLAILCSSGVPLLDALQVGAATISNLSIRGALERAREQVKGGVSLHRALVGEGQFPPMLINMVASGEASGTLPEMLERIADNQERAFSRQVDMALALFEPAMILLMGAIVLFIVLAVLLPIMQLNQGLRL